MDFNVLQKIIRAFAIFLAFVSSAVAGTRLQHFHGIWKVDTSEVRAYVRGIDQEGVYVIPDDHIPTHFIVSSDGQH